MSKREPFKYTTCAICGKQYIKQPGNMYHLLFAGNRYNFCSYTCYREGQKIKENTNEASYKKLKTAINKGDK